MLDVSLCSKTGQCVGVSGSIFNRVREPNRVVGGAVHHCTSPSAAGAYRIGCLATVPPTRIEGRLERADPPPPEASNTAYIKSPGERRGRETQKAEATTERVKPEVRPLVDPTSMCVTASIVSRRGMV